MISQEIKMLRYYRKIIMRKPVIISIIKLVVLVINTLLY